MTDEEIILAQNGDPWMFAPGDVVKHRKGGHYRVIAKALDEATKMPVYVYRAFLNTTHFATWVRPRAEMEDGRFTKTDLFLAVQEHTTIDDAIRAEREELIDALEGMLVQHVEFKDQVDSGCLSANAIAIRLLARLGRATLEDDGPGRSVWGRLNRG